MEALDSLVRDWAELRNKLEAFSLFSRAEGSGDVWTRLWIEEGRGYLDPRPPASRGLARWTGWGLAAATRTVESWGHHGDLAGSLSRFAALCREAAPPELAGAAFEGLGLAVRTLRPERAGEIDRLLPPDLQGLFWHGLGRGLYFAPSNAVPWGDPSGRTLRKALAEPAHRRGRRNAVAGLAWAMTLVDLRHPEIVDAFLVRCAERLAEPDAWSHGVAGAVTLWSQHAGRDPLLERFLSHCAASPAWETLVRVPAEAALRHAPTRWDALFQVPA
jgi:hypothetical protein